MKPELKQLAEGVMNILREEVKNGGEPGLRFYLLLPGEQVLIMDDLPGNKEDAAFGVVLAIQLMEAEGYIIAAESWKLMVSDENEWTEWRRQNPGGEIRHHPQSSLALVVTAEDRSSGLQGSAPLERKNGHDGECTSLGETTWLESSNLLENHGQMQNLLTAPPLPFFDQVAPSLRKLLLDSHSIVPLSQFACH